MKTFQTTTEHVTRGQLRSEPLKVIGHLAPTSVVAGTHLDDALRTMQANNGEPIFVTDGGRLVGILTERDVLLKVLGQQIAPGALVDAYMTRHPDCLTLDSTVGEALQLMDRGGYRTIPLVGHDGAVEGFVRQLDILEYVAEAFPQEILNLPPRPHQVMDQAEGA